jgi:membrane-bound lytic murein transglycosylase D
MVRRVAEVFVAANRGNYLLLMVFLGAMGCAGTTRLYPGSMTPGAHQLGYTINSYAGSSIPLSAASTPAIAPVETPTTTVIEPRASLRDEIPAHVLKHFERTVENTDSREKSAPPQPAAPARSAPKLLADNRLLDLLEKDLDKAIELPKERRRLQFSKEVINNPKVRHFVKHYSTTVKDYFQTVLARSGKFMPMISKVLIEEGLPEELAYLAIVESELLVNATSPVGAVGLWQFVPATARQYGLRIDQWVDERRDPIKSTRAAAAYLKELHSYYGRWFLVTAAYNAGPGIINKALQSSRASDFWGLKNKIREETRNFVPKFIATALIANDPKKYGFSNIPYQDPLEFEEVGAEGLLKIDTLAEMAESEAVTIKELNPALLRNLTPPGEKGYAIRVPVGKSAVFAKANDDLKGKAPASATMFTHEVKRGETLASIARYYGLAVKNLMQLNGLTSQRLKIGQQIKVIFDSVRATLR